MCVIAAEETAGNDSNAGTHPYIVIANDTITMYIARFLNYVASSECVEIALQENRNRTNKNFPKKVSTFLTNLKRELKIQLIRKASSDFISRMFVISEEDIKDESYWEYERYGIVIPEDLLQLYIERVFAEIQTSVSVPVNRNATNKTFRDALCSYTNSLSEDTVASLIQTADIKFVSRMFLSKDGYFEDKSSGRCEPYFMFISETTFHKIRHQWVHSSSHGNLLSNHRLTVNKRGTFLVIAYEHGYWEDVMLTVRRNIELIVDSLEQRPMFSSNSVECCFKFLESLKKKYMQRMIAEWLNGNVYDVFGNINLTNQTFLSEFLIHLKQDHQATQAKLVKTNDTNTGDSPLAVSCYFGINNLVEWCLKNNTYCNSCNKFSEHPLRIACAQNHPDIVRQLLNHKYEVDVNQKSGFQNKTPLYVACERGYKEVVSILLEKNVDVNLNASFSNKSPLFVACEYGHSDIVSLLMKHKADNIDVNEGTTKYFQGENLTATPLFVACKGGYTKIVDLLLNHSKDEVDVNEHTLNWETPLYAACEVGNNDIVSILLKHKPGQLFVNKSTVEGVSPLFVACREDQYDVVSTLLNTNGIDINRCMFTGMSPLSIASLLGHVQIVEMLLSKHADANICVKNRETVKNIFEKYQEMYKLEIHMRFCFDDYLEYIRKLVIDKAPNYVISFFDKMKRDSVPNLIFGSSPLHMGSEIGHIEIVKLLVNWTSDINCLNENGSTPLLLACELGHAGIVRELLDNGANPTLERKDGKSPISIASENGHMKITEMIQEHIVKL